MPLKPSYLLLVGGGAIVAYSGLKGKSVSSAIRDVISGQSPKDALAANGIMGTPASGGTSFAAAGTPGSVTPSGPGEKAFFTAVLTSIGAPATKANLTSLHNWRIHESPWTNRAPDGAQFTNNPLNTTLNSQGVVGDVNSIGVKIYATVTDGVIATAGTLLGGYPAIVSALRHGVGLSTGDPAVAAELSKWSGGGYSAV